MKIICFLISIFFLASCSCSKEEPKFTQTDIIDLARKIDPNLEEIQFDLNNTSDPRRVVCSKYGPGCVLGTGKRLRIRMVELIVIEFENEEAAKLEAARTNQWYSRNWLFDDVSNEPVLIDFVQKAFDAHQGQGIEPNP